MAPCTIKGGIIILNDTDAIEAAAKGTAEGTIEALFNKGGAFANVIFPRSIDRYEAKKYLKEMIKQDDNLNYIEKAILLSDADKLLKENMRKVQIAEKASSILHFNNFEDEVIKKNIEDDSEWFERFFDEAKFVSEEQLQLVWANILAQKISNPNLVPKSLTRILTEISKDQAEAVQIIANMNVVFFRVDKNGDIDEAGNCIFVPETKDNLDEYGINIGILEELEALGVLKLTPYAFDEKGKVGIFYNHRIISPYDFSEEGHISIGTVKLTQAGMCLANIADARILDGYLEKVRDYLAERFICVSGEELIIVECDELLESKIFKAMEE